MTSHGFVVPTKPRILVVDDDTLVRLSVTDILEDAGYETFSVESATRALELLDRRPIEIVLTDVTMEGMTGLELLRQIPTVQPAALCLVMTGYANKDIAIEALRAGALDLLEKPLTPELVQRAVERTWRISLAERENLRLLEDLRQSNSKLEASRAAAESSSREKGQLLARMSHEFRTPLNGIVGCLSLLGSTTLEDTQERLLDGAQQATAELLKLLEGLERDGSEAN